MVNHTASERSVTVADLPRFHKGGIGPLDYQTINEAFRRLDALRPLIESAGISQAGGIDDVKVTLVRASPWSEEDRRDKGEEGFSEDQEEAKLYSWEQILVRGDSEEYDLNANTIASPDDSDWAKVLADSSPRSGPNEEGRGYAISLDDNFGGGFAALFSYRRSDAKRCFVLFPLGNFTTRGLCVITNASGGLASFPMRNEEGDEEDAVGVYVCSARDLSFIVDEASGTTGALKKGYPFVLYDFAAGPNNSNHPSVPEGTELTDRPLLEGTIVEYQTATGSDGSKFRYRSGLPRLDVECEDEEGSQP